MSSSILCFFKDLTPYFVVSVPLCEVWFYPEQQLLPFFLRRIIHTITKTMIAASPARTTISVRLIKIISRCGTRKKRPAMRNRSDRV